MKDSGLADWHELYLAARGETDPEKVPERVGSAEHAVRLRMALQADPEGPEAIALKRALNSLHSLKTGQSHPQQKTKKPAEQPSKAHSQAPIRSQQAPGASRRELHGVEAPVTAPRMPVGLSAPPITPSAPMTQVKPRNWTKVAAWVGLTALLSFGTGWALAKRTRVKPQIQITEQYEAPSSQTPAAPNSPGADPVAADPVGAANHANPNGSNLPSASNSAAHSAGELPAATGGAKRPTENVDSPAEVVRRASPGKSSDANAAYQSTANGQTSVDVFATPSAQHSGVVSAPPAAPAGIAPQRALQTDHTPHAQSEQQAPAPSPSIADAAAATPQQSSPQKLPQSSPQASSDSAAGAPSAPSAAPSAESATPIPTGSVSVTYSAYPSIRVPPDVKARAAASGASLQIGHVVNRVEPKYPEQAARDHVEGTVKLHAQVGTDGAVQNVQVVDGPPQLAAAAVSAVRQWRYNPTLLGNEPIATGQDISVTFRIGTSR